MWNKLAAKELVEAYWCAAVAKRAPVEGPTAKNGWPLNGWNRATWLGEAEAHASRARLFRNKAREAGRYAPHYPATT